MSLKSITISAVIAAFLLSGCSHRADPAGGKRGSSGKTLEVLIIADNGITAKGTTTRTLVDSLLRCPQQGLMQMEPAFDVVYLPRSSYDNSDMFHAHRNIVLFDVNGANPDKVYFYRDREASPQVSFEFAARNRRSLDSLISVHAEQMVDLIYQTEHRRIQKAYRGTEGYKVEQQVRNAMGLNLTLSEEFRMAATYPNYCWVRKEAKDFSLHVLVYKEKYTNRNQFDSVSVLATVDSMMARVPASVDSSYIGTERRLDFVVRRTTLAGCPAVETRGVWRSFGDFMGGPYVSYTIATPDNKELLTLVGFVYSPRFPKRDYLMQVESICHSLSFDNQ
ncbi:MAG: DUF4837 family protein [Bacteroidales bacterium]|nr:DUF4837 family protein [Bacteroidales bacterium]